MLGLFDPISVRELQTTNRRPTVDAVCVIVALSFTAELLRPAHGEKTLEYRASALPGISSLTGTIASVSGRMIVPVS